ncbi:MAG: tyrosine recombinase XerC [Clostridia bacterium]
MKNYLTDYELPELVRKFLIYTQTVQNKSYKTTEEYALDLRLFFRYLIMVESKSNAPIDEIDISDVSLNFVKNITQDDIMEFLAYLATERVRFHKSEHSELGISAASRARKISCLRSFFKYLVDKVHILEVNPIANLDIPQKSKHLPKYLTLDESAQLINSVDGTFRERDLCIILLFLSCGLRVSELVGINIADIKDLALRIRGKGDKERMVYLNDSCVSAIEEYMKVRIKPNEADKDALFISRQGNRINVQTVKWIVKKNIEHSGINRDDISAHKLRHTAATLMYSNGLDIRTLQEVLGHKNLDTTMIYTHIDNANLRSAAAINPIARVEIKSNNSDKKQDEE